ncbi:MAG: hypothetical protein ACUVRU_04140, partial [Anaerolineae bacterium]
MIKPAEGLLGNAPRAFAQLSLSRLCYSFVLCVSSSRAAKTSGISTRLLIVNRQSLSFWRCFVNRPVIDIWSRALRGVPRLGAEEWRR